VIDLHTHTTASDGRCSPAELVARAAAAGVTVLSVTDHDTIAGCGAAAAAAEAAGIQFVPGIEITAVREDGDVHVLGYFIDQASPALHAFLARQRRGRLDRVRRMIHRLAACGVSLDADAILQPGIDDSGKAVGRPWIARALVAGGHVKTTNEAFDVWLAHGRPAFVPREGATPADVLARIHDAGGIASIAHPGVLGHDEWMPGLAAEGLDAIEAYHVDHDHIATARYCAMARRLNIAVSGGSDYHADDSHGAAGPGSVSLPREAFDQLLRRAAMRASASAADTSSSNNTSNPSN
jgi:predicted metal-dependent phosphoesterase TrpH